MIFRVASSALILNAASASAYMVNYGDMNLVSFLEFPTTRVIDRTFTSTSCAVKELSVGNELCPYDAQYPTRKLLRFSTGVWNQGPNDLKIPRDAKNNATLYDFGDCHRHYHFKNFTLYELVDQNTGAVITGRKQAFCLMDIRKMNSSVGPSLYTCSKQGISDGWADIYSYSLDGQWVDISGVPAGNYMLRVTINPQGIVYERNYTDNTAIETNIEIAGSTCPGPTSPVPPTSPPSTMTTCGSLGSSCATTGDSPPCCSAICDGSTMKCKCVLRSNSCTANHECCSNRCKSNTCSGNDLTDAFGSPN